jgi:sugar transferase (PEP-CTERM/EpsH1 system associated)
VRLLFLTPQLPFPPTQGAAIRNSHLIAGLSRRHAVDLLTFAPAGHAPGSWPAGTGPVLPGAERLVGLTLIPVPQRSVRDRLLTLLLTAQPDMAHRLASPALAAALRTLLQSTPYDWIITEGIEMAPYARLLDTVCSPGARARWLLDEHNAEYVLQQRAFLSDLRHTYQPRAAAGAAYSLIQWRRLRTYERAACRAADAVTAVSAADQEALERLVPALRVHVVPNGVDLAEWSRKTAPDDPAVDELQTQGPLIVFDGSMDFRPNIDAVRWFCATCWPRIRVAHPGATFAIVGRNPTAAVRALAALPGVRVTGAVPDTRPWVAGADVYVVPMRIGGGVRLKLLQALAMSCAIVSTRMGAEGIHLEGGRDLLLADSPADFADAVLALLADPPARKALGHAARIAVAPYAWERIVPAFEAVLADPSGEPDATSGDPVRVSVIMTVRNEADNIDTVIRSLQAQTRPPDEVVVVDGGSTDDTPARIATAAAVLPWPLRLLEQPGANISQGRNTAIRAAAHEIIAATDAGVRLPPEWLAALIAPFEGPGGPAIDVAGGFFAPDPRTVFERAMGATVLPTREDIKPERFLPSSRSVAFRKAAWAAAGGYPEWLDYSEDLVFDLALKARGCRFVFVPEALALFRPRGSLRAFYLQYYRYARGDGKADLWRKRHAIRYGTYLGGPLLAVLGRRRPALWALLALGAAAYCAAPYRRLRPWLAGLSPWESTRAVALVPIIRLVGDVAKMIGYPAGVWWRLHHRPPRPAAASSPAETPILKQ